MTTLRSPPHRVLVLRALLSSPATPLTSPLLLSPASSLVSQWDWHSARSGLTVSQVAEEYGKLFYIINPVTSSFSSLAECPDYVQQAMPYMVTLIILEAVVNLWLGKRHNLADSVTSISCGLLMTMVGLITKGSMISIYSWIHHHYRLLDLAWDSVTTWVLAALLVDLGYYWFHRASHEVGLLWAVHQVR